MSDPLGGVVATYVERPDCTIWRPLYVRLGVETFSANISGHGVERSEIGEAIATEESRRAPRASMFCILSVFKMALLR